MKIMISNDTDAAHLYDRISWVKVFNYCGHEAAIWDIRRKSAFDAFNEMKPDIFIGQLHNINRATFKCLLNSDVRVALKAGHWGDVDKDIDQTKYPVLMASDDQKGIAEALINNGKLDFVFVHYNQKHIDYTMGGWRNIIKPVGIMNGCDTFAYVGGEVRKEWECDMNFIGGNWPYKGQMLNKYLYPLCNPIGKFNIKIFGNSTHPVGQYVGTIQEENVKHLFKSSKINLDVAEPHAYLFSFDISEKLFKVAGANGFYLSMGKVLAQKEVFGDLIKVAENEEDIKYWLQYPIARIIAQEQLTKEILEKHTHFDRCSQFMYELGLPEEGKKILEKKNEGN